MGQAELVSPAQPAGSGTCPLPAAVRSRTSAWDAEGPDAPQPRSKVQSRALPAFMGAQAPCPWRWGRGRPGGPAEPLTPPGPGSLVG